MQPYYVCFVSLCISWVTVLILTAVRFLRASVCFGAIDQPDPQTYALSASYAQLGDPTVAAAMPKL